MTCKTRPTRTRDAVLDETGTDADGFNPGGFCRFDNCQHCGVWRRIYWHPQGPYGCYRCIKGHFDSIEWAHGDLQNPAKPFPDDDTPF